jgi:peptidoglycan/xylan/chitin deacetylase (PgdA/CDA1 family)
MFYLHHTPFWLRMLFPKGLIWDGPVSKGDEVYLTFDDGPHPEATPFVLDQLDACGMKGTFFCIGKNVAKYPEIMADILKRGHAVGNHTMHHLNAKQANAEDYLKDVKEAAELISSNFFRPPYGQIRSAHTHAIRNAFPSMKMVMWSVLTGDFDTSRTGEQCFAALRKNTRPGSIIVFHDSAKAFERLRVALPLTLEWLKQQGLSSSVLPA